MLKSEFELAQKSLNQENKQLTDFESPAEDIFDVIERIFLNIIGRFAAKPKQKNDFQRGNEHILLVDDEESIILMETKMLTRIGYQVTSCSSSIEALEIFHSNPDIFDLVITDLAMPGLPGDKLSLELTKIRPDIPILLCSGFCEDKPEEVELSKSINGFLTKPISTKVLTKKIREVLDRKPN